MNNNMLTERGLQGLFSTTSYNSIGDPYGKKSQKDPRFGGKQFNADFPKGGISGSLMPSALFAKKHDWLFGGEKYVDRTMYIKTQPPDQRKKGFLSSDARRRDEFTLDIEVNKWRERIGTEMMFAERSRQMQEDKMTPEERAEAERIAREPPPHRWTHGPKYLFDLGKEVTGGTTPYEMKDARDTWFSMQRVKQMAAGDDKPSTQRQLLDTGGVMTSSQAVGTNLRGYESWTKPEFARQPVIRDNFFRSTGVLRSVY